MTTIGNGMNLHVIQSSKFKTMIFCVLIRRPLSRTEATMNALIPNIIKRGSQKYDSLKKINAAVEDLYGGVFESQIIKKGEEQILQFYMEVIDGDRELMENALGFLRELMLSPLIENGGFRSDYTTGEMENLKKSIQGRINNKTEYAKLKCIEHMCKVEAFGIYGDGYPEDLDSLRADQLYAHYRHVLETSPIEFICIGNTEEAILSECVKRVFDIERKDIINIPRSQTVFDKKNRQTIEERFNAAQAKLAVGLRSGVDPMGAGFYNLLVANEIIGGGPNSRLFINIREKKSLCYTVHSFIYRFKTIMMIQSGIEADQYRQVADLIEKEIEDAKKGVTDEELDSAKKSLIKKFKGLQDYPSSVIDFYMSQYMLEDDDTLQTVIEKLENVKKEGVLEAAQGLFIDTVYLLR